MPMPADVRLTSTQVHLVKQLYADTENSGSCSLARALSIAYCDSLSLSAESTVIFTQGETRKQNGSTDCHRKAVGVRRLVDTADGPFHDRPTAAEAVLNGS